MPIRSIQGTDLKYYLVAFDATGREREDDPDGRISQLTLKALENEPVTDVFILSHGWKGDVPAAIEQYDRWIGAMLDRTEDIQRIRESRPGFLPLLIGLHWPSLPWGDENLNVSFAPTGASPIDQMIDIYAERIAGTARAREALRVIFEEARNNLAPEELPENVRSAYETLNEESGMGSEGVAPGDDREPFDAEAAYQSAREEEEELNFGARELGGILSPLRQLSFWKMKDRARSVGESGAFELLRHLQLKTEGHNVRFHLMGHSFGCIVVSAMVAGPPDQGESPRPVDSLVLIQGAFSLWSYCPKIPYPPSKPGYFHSIVRERRVKGPIITTQSRLDTAVGRFYPLGAGVRGDIDFALKPPPKYGGVGAFGICGLEAEAEFQKMLPADGSYGFEPGRIYNLESSSYIREGGGASGAHSDIARPEVAHAVWEAARSAG